MPKLLSRRRIAQIGTVALAMPALRLAAQELPANGVIVSGFAAGGTQDILARLLAEEFKQSLGVSFIVENRTGAGGTIAARSVKSAPPDGGTLLIANIVAMSLAPFAFPNLNYDPVKDFTPVGKTAEFQVVLATGPATGQTSFHSLMDWAKANPSKANVGIPATGSLPHLYLLRMAEISGVPLTPIPYRGGAPIAQDLASGQVQMGIAAPPDFIELHRAKKLTMVASSGTARLAVMSDVPTWSELGLRGLEKNSWTALFLPPGTSPAIAERYTQAMKTALAKPDLRAKLENLALVITPTSGAELRDQIIEEMKVWGPVVKKAMSGAK